MSCFMSCASESCHSRVTVTHLVWFISKTLCVLELHRCLCVMLNSWTWLSMWLDHRRSTICHRPARLRGYTFFGARIISPIRQYCTASPPTVIMKSCISCVRCLSSTPYVCPPDTNTWFASRRIHVNSVPATSRLILMSHLHVYESYVVFRHNEYMHVLKGLTF